MEKAVDMDHSRAAVLVRPSPAAAVVAAAGYSRSAGAGTVWCAGCPGAAGDYLEPPDLSTPCCRCGGGVPLCRVCAADPGDGEGTAADVSCASCDGFVCPAAGCSTRCSDEACEVGGYCVCVHTMVVLGRFLLLWVVVCWLLCMRVGVECFEYANRRRRRNGNMRVFAAGCKIRHLCSLVEVPSGRSAMEPSPYRG